MGWGTLKGSFHPHSIQIHFEMCVTFKHMCRERHTRSIYFKYAPIIIINGDAFNLIGFTNYQTQCATD